MSQVAGIQTDADRLVPFSAQFLEDLNGIGYAALERIDRIHQQQAVVGINIRIGTEGADFAVA